MINISLLCYNLNLLLYKGLQVFGVFDPDEFLEILFRHPTHLSDREHISGDLVDVIGIYSRQTLDEFESQVLLEVIILLI